MSISIIANCLPIDASRKLTQLDLPKQAEKIGGILARIKAFIEPTLDLSAEEFDALPTKASIEVQTDIHNEVEAYIKSMQAAIEQIGIAVSNMREERFQNLCAIQSLNDELKRMSGQTISNQFQLTQGERYAHQSYQKNTVWADHTNISPDCKDTPVCNPEKFAKTTLAYDREKAHKEWEADNLRRAKYAFFALHSEFAQPFLDLLLTLQNLFNYAYRVAKPQIQIK